MAAGWLQTAVRVAIGFVQIRLVIGYLSEDLAGTWFLFLSLAGYVAFFDLGVSPTLSREIGFALGRARNESAGRKAVADLIATSMRVFWVLAAVVFVLALPTGLWFLGRVAPEGEVAAVRAAWCVFCFGASLNILGNAAFASLYGLGSVGSERTMQALTQVLGFGLLCLAIVLDLGLMGLAVAWTIQGILLRLLGWLTLRRLHPWLRGRGGAASLTLARSLAMPSVKWMLVAFGAILILNTDNVLIASVLGAKEIPAYHAVAQVVTLAMQLSLMIVTSSTPFVSRAHAEGDHEQTLSILMRNLRFGMGLMILIGAGLLVYGDLLIDLWLGPGNFVGRGVLLTFVVMLLLETHHRVHATVIMARGELVFHWAALTAGLLNLAISLVLMQFWGLLGVALGTMLAQLVTNNWYVPWYSARSLGFSVPDYLKRIVLPLSVLLAGTLAAGCGLRLATPEDWPPLLRLLVGSGAMAATGAALAYALVTQPGERASLRRVLRGGARSIAD